MFPDNIHSVRKRFTTKCLVSSTIKLKVKFDVNFRLIINRMFRLLFSTCDKDSIKMCISYESSFKTSFKLNLNILRCLWMFYKECIFVLHNLLGARFKFIWVIYLEASVTLWRLGFLCDAKILSCLRLCDTTKRIYKICHAADL